ncbi:hypothetical protein ACFVHQ_04945 [Actinomycetes bacterium NPDC127524]
MKKYWKTSLIIATSIICIGTFYIQSAQSVDNLPQYRINPEEGGAGYIKSVVLEGSYLNGDIPEPVDITANGTVYTGKLPFFESLKNSAAHSKRIKELQSKYHNFMRGKSEESNFYEDSNKLAYAEITGGNSGDNNNLTFKVSQLEKKDGSVTSIKMPVPGSDKYNYIFLSEVQSIGSKINVVTTNSVQVPDEANNEEIHVYTFDMHKGKLLNNQTIEGTQEVPKNVHVSFEKANEADEMGPDDYLVFKKVSTEQITKKDGETGEGETKIDWVVFNLKENIQVKTEIPQELTSGEESLPVYHHGSVLYFSLEKDHVLHLYKFDAASSTPAKEIAIPLGQRDPRVQSLLIYKEKVFVMAVSGEEDSGGKDQYLIAADLDSGKPVFKGSILEGKGNKKPGKNIQIQGISIN